MRLRILLDAFLAGGPSTAPAGQAAPELDVLDVLIASLAPRSQQTRQRALTLRQIVR